MSAPRLEIRLDHLQHNARVLVDRLARRGIAVTGVTKATLGSPEVARAMLRGGVVALGESRIENIEALHAAGLDAPMVLIRSPMASQVERVVAHAGTSLNSEPAVIDALARAARDQGCIHRIVLMVELGDLREGIMPADVDAVARQVLRHPSLELHGIGANLACQSGVIPDQRNMDELTALAASIARTAGTPLAVVSGGNSATLEWAVTTEDTGLVNDLRLGESVLLGREPSRRTPLAGLHLDAFTLVAEVIEAKTKPTRSWGAIAETAFGTPAETIDRGDVVRVILGVGRQDIDPDGLEAPLGWTVLGASSDHLVLDAGTEPVTVGDEVRFGLTYGALLRAMTSPFVHRSFC
jgi:predicted amino acid racemase